MFVLAGFESPQHSTRSECFPPNLAGLTTDAAASRLRAVDMRLGHISAAASTAPRGTIVSQRPKACSDAGRGTAVDVVISNGRGAETQPNREGGSSIGKVAVPVAAAAIVAAILAARRDKPEPAETPVQPPPQEPAQRSPDRTAVVPAVTGLSLDEAQRAIAAAQLRTLVTNPAEAQDSQAVVSAQVPGAGTAVVPGATVGLTMAPPPPPSVQNPVAPVPIASPVVVPPVAATLVRPPASVTPPAPPTPPLNVQPTPTVLPAQPVTFNVPVTAPQVIPVRPGGAAGAQESEPAARVPVWPWMVIALLAAVMGLVRWLRRRASRASAPTPDVSPAFTFVARPDPGVQTVTGPAESRTLDVFVRLDPGTQVLRPHVAFQRIGAIS